MSESRGHFVWCELMTTDAAAAAEFYRAVVGWNARDAGASHVRYTILSAGDADVGGLVEMPASACADGWKPGWVGYVGVDDVDAFSRKVSEAGGAVHRAPEDIPGVGRFAVVADPQGATFTLFKPLGFAAPSPTGPTLGGIGWRELHAADWETAFAFYAKLFGWTKTEAIDLGPMGTYQTFATGGPTGAAMVGGMMTKSDAIPKPAWFYYFTVDDAGAAAARARQAGGEILRGPHQVPGGSWIVQGLDPQGAMFAVVGPPQPA